MARIGKVEKGVRAELAASGHPPATSLVEAALLLARRLDGDPAEHVVPGLARELRMTMAALRALGDAAPGELDAFLAGIQAEEFK